MKASSLKKLYRQGRLPSNKIGSTKVYRRESPNVASLSVRVLGAVNTNRPSKETA